jgi:hypothetical protein
MRKLTVKNFSVIKEAELEFGEITVLIGPQSSGKSLLCKLAYFLGKTVIDIAAGRVINDFEISDVENAVKKEFAVWFPHDGWGLNSWEVRLLSGHFAVSLSSSAGGSRDSTNLSLEFSGEFVDTYKKQLQSFRREAPAEARIEAVPYINFRRLMGKGIWDTATYIPSERAYFVDTQRGYSVLANESEPLVSAFAMFYANSMKPEIPKLRMHQQLGGEIIRGEDFWLFAFDDGRTLPLSHLSAGSKSLITLLSVLEMYQHQRPATKKQIQAGFGPAHYYHDDEFFIEEPEADIFPQTQYEVVRYLAELRNEEDIEPHFTITTHSPYILSSFNNLLEAWQVGHTDEERGKAIREIIDEKYWVNPQEFRAYSIKGGYLDSIMDKETHLISDNFLDSVSERIGGEFDQLLRIGYVEA